MRPVWWLGVWSELHRYRYYRDPGREKGLQCDQYTVPADSAEEALGGFLRRLSLPHDWQKRVIEMIQQKADAQRDIGRERSRIEGQLKRLFVLSDLAETEYKVERD